MTSPLRALIPLLVLLAWAAPAMAQLAPPVEVRGVWSGEIARPGDQRVLAVVLDMAPGWHVNPDAARTAPSLIPTTVEVTAHGQVVTVGAAQFPEPQQVIVPYPEPDSLVAAYEHRAVIYVPVAIATGAQPGPAAVTARVVYQACNDQMCMPPKTVTLETPLEIVSAGMAVDAPSPEPELFAGFDWSSFAKLMAGDGAPSAPVGPVRFDVFDWRFEIDPSGAGFWLLLAVAAVGGALLNFTPCVLPVIPIKIMSLSRAAGNRARCLLLGATMALGVVAFWLAIGVAIIAVSGFGAINQLFQETWFTIGVGAIIALMGMGMFGLFTVGLPQWVYQVSPRHDTLTGSFGFGIMTAVLSTPCTAPFMGSAAAWAATRDASTALATFAAIGGGMAAPYLVLSAFPILVERMPRTGPASELIKQTMGLLMLAAAAYFIGVGISSLTAADGESTNLYWWPVMAFIALAACWVIYRTWQITGSIGRRLAWTAVGSATILAAGMGGVRLTDDGPIDWVTYTPDAFARELASGNVVVMDFTAEWCLNCKALEHGVLYREPVVELFEDRRVVPMKVDITSSDNVAGTQMLQEVGRVAIPLLVVFAPDGSEVFKSDAYTVAQVVDAVKRARGDTDAQADTLAKTEQ